MKILIDIGHPAHVHYFKNFIKIMEKKNHKIIVVARNRKHIFDLLTYYKINYFSRGKGANNLYGKLLYTIYADLLILYYGVKYKVDTYVSFSTGYPVHIGTLLRKNTISINDTEHTDKIHKKFVYPFSKAILTPSSYSNYLGKRHVRFNNIMESLYLDERYFTPDKSIYKYLNIRENEKYVVLRFVSWNAHHDLGQKGLSNKDKRELIKLLSVKYKVFISSEGEIDKEYKKYSLIIPPHKMHDILYYSTLFIGESGTMASESARLGTHAIYVNSLPLMCYLRIEKEVGLLTHFESSKGVVTFVKKHIKSDNLKQESIMIRDKMIRDFIDPNAFLAWFIETFPASFNVMKEKPEFQERFK